MLHPDDHASYLAKHDFVIPPGEFTTAEAELLTKYGRWMDALATGLIKPTTPSQEQFLRVAAGEAEPTTDFEKAWSKVKKERAIADEAVQKFQALRAARAQAAALEARYREARQAVLATVREKLDAVDSAFAEQIQSATDASAAAEKAVREFILKIQRSLTLTGIRAAYRSGNVTWDREKMSAYAKLHPEVMAFRKTGHPSVALQFGDGATPGGSTSPAVSESGEAALPLAEEAE
jgi:uncharacterized protein YifE (UPF0438 family)